VWRLVKKYVEKGINVNALDMRWQMDKDHLVALLFLGHLEKQDT